MEEKRKNGGPQMPPVPRDRTGSDQGVKIETRRVAGTKDSPFNPRKIDKASLDGLKRSIERFGLVEPIIVNERTGHVVGGHQRLKVLKAKKEKTTSVVLVDLDEKDEKALNVALNNPHIQGEFDENLDMLLSELRAEDEALLRDLRLDALDVDFGEPPESVAENLAKLDKINAQRRSANDGVIEKNDTERYLVVVFPSRHAREQAVKALGLPPDERYVDASAVEIHLIGKTIPRANAAPPDKAGAHA
jgi:hypothetical protein